jgi:His-Xaa-Ser system protein HxsD
VNKEESTVVPSATARFEFAIDGRDVAVVLEEAAHSVDAILEAAYLFVDRCYVFVAAAGEGQVAVRLRPKQSGEGAEALAQAFAAAVRDQAVRRQLGASTMTLREYYVGRALFVDPPRPNIDAILAELDAPELEDDPLDIRLPWDEKRKKEERA